MADEFTNADRATQAAAAAAQSPEVDWVAFARTGGELARRSLEAFLTRQGLTGTNWDPREPETAPSRGIDTETLHALEEHERRAGQFQTIASMANRYEQAVAAGDPDVEQWRADVVGAVDDYGLTGTLVDPRGPQPAGELTPTARMDQAHLADAARIRVAEVEAGFEEFVEAGGARVETIDVALYRFADASSVDIEQRVAAISDPMPGGAREVDPVRVAAQIQSGSRADLWDESDWPDRESGEELAPLVSVALRRPVQDTLASPQFVAVLAEEVADARTHGEDLPEVTAADRAEALRLAPRVWDALVDRGEQLPPQPEWWASEREQLRADSPTLQARMEQAYLDGYDERIRSGLAYAAAADDAERNAIGGDVAAEKVASYAVLEQTRRTLDEEVPPMLAYSDDAATAPLSAAAEGALVDAAHEAGRWSALDAGADDLLTRIDSRLAEHEGAPSVYAGDERDAWFRYLDPDVQTARQALPQLERDNTVRATRALTEQQPRQGRGALFERLRERRDERRAQTASLTDPGRQTTTPQQAQSIK